ncbi:hypothetical protein [uncultured Treponema sp.]|uniref:hypothetical protein n=1 Tax=uncultured Treponema sp. TaxID=162155 RepID=UPI0025E1E05C|nr:hypothetical protein [uncultured Treponema sp.]
MSTSLEKDLHSVYIDGEMPENFVSQYEQLISQNESGKADLEKMQKLHEIFREDSESITKKIREPSSDSAGTFLEESFERLQTKMRYAKNISFARTSNSESSSFITPFAKYAASFMAAAAVFAVVFVPIHYNSLNSAKETAVAAISIMKEKSIEPIAKTEVVVDGNINPKGLAVGSAKVPDSTKQTVTEASSSTVQTVEQKTVYATSLASNYGGKRGFLPHSAIGQRFREKLTAVDPFIPDFSSSSITIPIPNFHEIDNNLEMMNNQQE